MGARFQKVPRPSQVGKVHALRGLTNIFILVFAKVRTVGESGLMETLAERGFIFSGWGGSRYRQGSLAHDEWAQD